VVVIVAAGIAVRMHRQSPAPQPAPQAAVQAPTAVPAPVPEKLPLPPSKAVPAKDLPPRPAQPPAKARPKKEAAVAQQPAAVEPPRQATEPPAEKAAPPPPATLRLVIVPWGEVFVDGKSRGVSPPLRDLTLSPGKHQIVVQNTTFAPYSQQLELKPGEQITIRHRFD
jgi:hypothetical protein